MAKSPPIGMARTEYVMMQKATLTSLNNYQEKRYQMHGMYLISNSTLVRLITVPNTYNPRCTFFPHLAFFPKDGFGQGVFNEAPQNP